ncbi:GMC family oxidoreductase [Pseudomonas petrae]|uniref:Choline dehydrogenase n=1 Tax=Pseudomonas petrae TaxID=2912190 RepID=A0ABS9I965_9PSED|nr:choline dehydrogenase [Pseudomonas petrae]MCF7531015.1 choline dehydrogenase [Pseudomonas petrae]MCF7536691.1 choline dehydrogenase [Pseudomonas petrae]MCF7544302.1 choline dehydrogenase [Pseudomonas petrae]MCF7554370.1 choline dehydrogenase [Pseudomonas petrae]
MLNNVHEYDYVIVGAGSAGCVLANRLSTDPAVTVCLIEAGPSDKSIFIQMPAALTFPIESDVFNWKFESEPEPELHGRTIGQARGRCLGGSSSINGMVYVRGSRHDYDSWRQLGVEGWDFDDCLPYFRKMESFESGRDPARGGDGPITVTRSKADHPLYQSFLKAGQEFGLADAGDYNSGSQEGVHVTQATIRDGVRCSTSLAYLKPAIRRPNLTVLTECLVERVNLENKVATGVTLTHKGEQKVLHAAREVVLCAGTIGSPQLLMLSGIGERTALAGHGIECAVHLPGVGADLQDHVVAPLRFTSPAGVSISRQLGTLGRLKLGIQWSLFKTGLGATPFFEVGSFFKSSDDVDYFNMQHEFLPFLADFQSGKVHIADGFQYFVSQMRPHSRGSIALRSANPQHKPIIRFNYLTDARDVTQMVNGIRKTLQMVEQPAWAAYRSGAVETPTLKTSDAELAVWLRQVANTEHHPTSTCRMGNDDFAVTDSKGLVHGVQRLRIVDGSILPKVPTANINAPIIMVAEKIAADMTHSDLASMPAHAKEQVAQ